MTLKSTARMAVAAFVCFACNSNSEMQTVADKKEDVEHLSKNLDSAADYKFVDTLHEPQQAVNKNDQNPGGIPPKSINWDKKIVKNAKLNAEVKDYKAFSQQLNEKVRKYGGYIGQEEQSQSDYQIQNSVVIKVPVDQFENAINDITKDVFKLKEKHISSEDVTTQLIDGKSRLEAKKQVRLRYLDLIKQARNMGEILTVQKEINDIQEDIELVNGRINSLSHESAMSTINLTFFQIIDANAKADNEKQPNFLSKVKEAFANGWYWMGELFVALTSIWPLLLLIGMVGWLIKKRQIVVPKPKE